MGRDTTSWQVLTAATLGGVACLTVWLLTAPAEGWLLATAGCWLVSAVAAVHRARRDQPVHGLVWCWLAAGLLLGALLAVGVLTLLRPFG